MLNSCLQTFNLFYSTCCYIVSDCKMLAHIPSFPDQYCRCCNNTITPSGHRKLVLQMIRCCTNWRNNVTSLAIKTEQKTCKLCCDITDLLYHYHTLITHSKLLKFLSSFVLTQGTRARCEAYHLCPWQAVASSFWVYWLLILLMLQLVRCMQRSPRLAMSLEYFTEVRNKIKINKYR